MQSLADEFSGANFLLETQGGDDRWGGLGQVSAGEQDAQIMEARARQAELDAAMRSGEVSVSIGRAAFGQNREENVLDRVRMLMGILSATGGAIGAPGLAGRELIGGIAARNAALPVKDRAAEAIFSSGYPEAAGRALTGVAAAAGGFLLPGLAQAEQPVPGMVGTGAAARAGDTMRPGGVRSRVDAGEAAGLGQAQPAPAGAAQQPTQIDYGIQRQVTQDQATLTPQQFMQKYGTMDGQQAMQRLQVQRATAKPWYQFW